MRHALTNRRRYVRRTVVMITALGLAATPVAAFGQTPPRDRPALQHTCYAVPGADFPDLGSDDTAWRHGTAIDCLRAYDLVRGTAVGTYAPDATVPRWQMAVFLARMARLIDEQIAELDLSADPPPARFSDIGGLSEEAQDAIALLVGLRVTQGTTRDTFTPAAAVSRAQMSTFIDRLQAAIQEACCGDVDRLGFHTADDFFVDDESNPHEDGINGIASVGITKGEASRRFRPGALVTRAQMASFLVRYLGVNVDRGLLTSAFPEPDDPADPETISQDFVDAVAAGDLDAAAALSTPRVIAAVSNIDDIAGVAQFEFFPATPDSPELFEYGGGAFTVVFDLADESSRSFNCRTEAGLVRTCRPPAP